MVLRRSERLSKWSIPPAKPGTLTDFSTPAIMGPNGPIPLRVSNSSKLSVPYPGKRIDVLSIVGTHTLLIIRGAITATQSGSANFLPATSVVRTIVVK